MWRENYEPSRVRSDATLQLTAHQLEKFVKKLSRAFFMITFQLGMELVQACCFRMLDNFPGRRTYWLSISSTTPPCMVQAAVSSGQSRQCSHCWRSRPS